LSGEFGAIFHDKSTFVRVAAAKTDIGRDIAFGIDPISIPMVLV